MKIINEFLATLKSTFHNKEVHGALDALDEMNRQIGNDAWAEAMKDPKKRADTIKRLGDFYSSIDKKHGTKLKNEYNKFLRKAKLKNK